MSKRGIEQVIGDDAEKPRVRETIAVQVCANNKHKPVPEY
jgi:aspartate/glutamate racemase